MAHPTRMPGFDYRGRIRVFITVNVAFHQPLLAEDDVADYVRLQLLRFASARDVEVTVYCILRDHLHVLLTGLSYRAHIPSAVARWKQRTGYWYRHERPRETRGVPRLWQKDYLDRVIRKESETLEILRYIATDPLRSNLVEQLEDYRWLGSECWSRDDLIEIASVRGTPYWWPGGGARL